MNCWVPSAHRVWLSPAAEQPARTLKQIQELVARMNAGQVKTLFIHGVNPLFELPAAFGFAEALEKVDTGDFLCLLPG